jgi:hypothetical protein
MFVAPMFQKSRRVVTILGQLDRANSQFSPASRLKKNEMTSQIWMD